MSCLSYIIKSAPWAAIAVQKTTEQIVLLSSCLILSIDRQTTIVTSNENR